MKITQIKEKAWVVVFIIEKAPETSYVDIYSFAYTRSSCIKKFIKGSTISWRQWYYKNARCLKVELVRTTIFVDGEIKVNIEMRTI